MNGAAGIPERLIEVVAAGLVSQNLAGNHLHIGLTGLDFSYAKTREAAMAAFAKSWRRQE